MRSGLMPIAHRKPRSVRKAEKSANTGKQRWNCYAVEAAALTFGGLRGGMAIDQEAGNPRAERLLEQACALKFAQPYHQASIAEAWPGLSIQYAFIPTQTQRMNISSFAYAPGANG
jgi:hypothetical protein